MRDRVADRSGSRASAISYRIAVLVGLGLIGGCSRPERASVAARHTTISPDSIDSLVARHLAIDSAFAQVGDQLVYMRDSSERPNTADAEVHVSRAPTGEPLRYLEAPVSPSGDWHLELIHYFDADGHTQRFVSLGSYFRDGCGTGIMVDHRTTSYRPDFTVIESHRVLADSRGDRVDSARCGHPYEFFAGTPRPTFSALRRAGAAPQPH